MRWALLSPRTAGVVQRVTLVFLGGTLFGTQASGLDPARALTQYSRETWTSRTGLPQDSVQAITQTDDGYLWLATRAGLVRFDGMRFDAIAEGKMTADVWSLHRGRSGDLWLGTEGNGLLHYQDGRFEVFDQSRGLTSANVRTILEGRDGGLWVATDGGGLDRLKDGKISAITVADGLPSNRVWSLCEDRRGRLWIGTDGGGLAVLEAGRVRAIPRVGPFSDGFVWAIHEDPTGVIWAGTSSGLLRIEGDRAKRFTKRQGLAGDTVRAILTDRDGVLWVGTTEGLSRLRHGVFESLPPKDDLASGFVRALFEDRDGNLWVGSYGGGLDLIRDGLFTVFGEPEGISGAVVRAVMEARDGSMWVGTNNGGVSRIENGKVRAWTVRDGLSSNVVLSLCEDTRGRIWVGTNGWGANVIDSSGVRAVEEGRIPSSVVRTLHCAADGSIWVGTTAGLAHLSDTGAHVFRTEEGLPANFVRAFHEGASGRIWVGTSGGISVLENGQLRSYGKKEGLPGEVVESIVEETSGTVWIATDGGLARMKDGRIRPVSLRPAMPDGLIHSIQADDLGHLWFSSARGVFRFRKALLDSLAEGEPVQLTASVYDAFDGMRSLECTGGGFHPASARDRQGRLWFPTARGVVVVDPVKAAAVEPAPPVRIEMAAVDESVLPTDRPVVVPPRPGRVAFHFAALSLDNPRGVRFRYRLEGYENDWIEAGRGRVAVYTALPPGDYTFRVAARRREGPWSESPALLGFRIAPAFVQTWWFAALLATSVGLALWGGVRLRVRRSGARERQAEDLVAERTRELQEEFGYRLQVEEGLRESEERFRAFVEQSSEGIILVDERGRAIEWNRAMEEITGLARVDVLGHPIREVQDGAFDVEGTLPPGGLDSDFEIRQTEGRRAFVQQTAFRIPTSRGLGTGSLIRDVTARRNAEQEREELIAELESRNAELERFTYTVSHDLRSPLVTVRGFLGYLEKHAADGRIDDLRSDVERIRKATSRMDDLLRDLLELSRIGRKANPPVDIPFGDLVREALEVLQGVIAERSVRITIHENLPVVRGDRTRLVEVVQNLLHNAVKFGGSEPKIEVGSGGRDPGDKCVLFVRDQGIGIDPRHLHRVFGLFDKLDPQIEGTGIGLAIVKRVVEVHGGRVWAESDGTGQGATFYLTLPAAETKRSTPP